MPGIRQLAQQIANDPEIENGFNRLYGPEQLDDQRKRYHDLLEKIKPDRPDADPFFISAPGRTELGGNHTDHNNGRVLASAVDLDCVITAHPTHDNTVSLFSDRHDDIITVDLGTLAPAEHEKGTAEALVRGVASGLKAHSINTNGFTGYLSSTCLPGTGLSSSAAFSVLIGAVFSHLDGDTTFDPVRLALIARFAENNYFGKPCGLMDQLSSAVGGTIAIDFKTDNLPEIIPLETDLNRFGYQMAIVNTGGSHAELTPQYAAIPEEIHEAVQVFNREIARGISMEMVLARLPDIRARAGDRAALRLMHFIGEDKRAAAQATALQRGDFQLFLSLVEESGRSSCGLLQNCSSLTDTEDQGVLLALALTEEICSGGVCRVHGGGFAGTIQVYIPLNDFERYRTFMNRIFGAGAVMPVRTGRPGVCSLTTGGWHFPSV